MNVYRLRDKAYKSRQLKENWIFISALLVASLFIMRLTEPSLAMGAQDPSLVGLWHMDGDWTDASGNGHNGTASSSATFSTDAHVGSQSGNFNGVSGYVQVMMAVPAHNFTIEAWAKTSNPGGIFSVNAGSFSGSNGSDRNLYVNSNGYACIYVWQGPAWCTNKYVADNAWHHWALVVSNGVGQTAYIDGQLVGSNAYDHSDFNWQDRITIGYGYYGGYFNGLIDEVAVYNRALTADEISKSYDAGFYAALWHMDGDWTDATGNGNNGTATGAIFSTDARMGINAGSFDGVGASVNGTAYSLPLGNSPRAVSAWIKTGNGTQNRSILQYGTGSASNFQLFIDSTNRAAIGTDSGSISGTSVLSDSQWHYVVGVYEGTGTNIVRIYVDGVQENSGTITAPSTISGNFSIGAFLGGGGYFNGLIDEAIVYNRAITADQINKAYNGGIGRVGLWHMDGGWTDASGTGNNGTGYNGVTFSTNAQVGSQAGSFDGVDDYVMAGTGSIISAPNTFTIAFWANPAGTRTVTAESNSGISGIGGQQYAIGPMPSGANSGAGVSVGTNGISVFEHGNSYLPSLLVYNAPITGWNHIVVVYQNKQPNLYVNGQFVRQGLISQRPNVYPSTVFGNVVNYGPYHGLIDEVAVYNRALTTDEINRSYNAGLSVALWHMDGDWKDATGNGNNGTATSAVFSADARVGTNAGSFDGVSASVNGTAYSLPLGNSPRAVSAWIKTGNGTQNRSILQYGTGSASNFQLFIDSTNRAAIGTDSGSISGTSILSDSQWHYVVGVYEGTSTNTVRIYVDGVQENSGTTSPPGTVNGSFSIGAFLGGGGYFNGLIDEVIVYNRAITVDQINKAYNGGIGRVGLWHMNGDWTDASGNGNNGTGYNGVTFSNNARVGPQAGSFDGVDDYVMAGTGSIVSTPNTFTIAFWANPAGTRTVTDESNSGITGMGGQQYAIAPMYSGSNGGAGVSVGTNGISVFEHGSSYLPSLLVYNAPLAGWNHIVIVYQNKQPNLYVNGQFVRQGLISQRPNVYPSTVFGNVVNYGPYHGLIDDVGIYNRAISADEIRHIYNAGIGGTPPGAPIVQPVLTTTYDDVVTLSGTKPAGTSVWVNGVEIVFPDDFTSWTQTYTMVPGSNTLSIMTQDSSGRLSDPATITVNVLPANQLDPSLLGLWHMDGNWLDYSGTGNNGTGYNGVTFSANARVGTQASSFDGVDDYVMAGTGSIVSAPNTFTIAFWANPAGTRAVTAESNSDGSGTSGQQYAIAPMPSGSNGGAGVSVGTNGISVFEHGNNYLPSLLVYNAPIMGWNHIVVVYQNKQPNLYVNGQFVRQGLISQRPNVYPSTVFGNVINYGPYHGLIDEVSIYNRALGTQEIINLYAAIVPYVQIISPIGMTNNNTPFLNYTVVNGTATAVKVDGNIVSKVSGSNLDILSDGTHTLRVEVINTSGTVAFTETVFTVDTVPPTISINPVTSPTITATQTITGNIESGATVTVSVNTTAVAGLVTYPTLTTWSCTVTNLAWGSNIITATAFDAAGNSAVVNATINQDKINVSNVAVNSNSLDLSAPNTVSIFFIIDNPALVTLKIILQTTGTQIYQASQNCSAAGAYLFTWNGKDNTGRTVPDNAYLYTLEATVDGITTGIYSPAASGASGTPSVSYSRDIDPSRNIPATINFSNSTASICTIWCSVPSSAWSHVPPILPAWGYKIADSVPVIPGVNYYLDWDGRDRSGKQLVQPDMLITGTSVHLDIFAQCSPHPLPENYIITSGDTPKISQVKTDPNEMQFSYGEFTKIKYHLSRDANVTIALIPRTGGTITLVNSQPQSAGDQEFDWNGIDSTDTSGKKVILSAEGSYMVKITAASPTTGSNSSGYANLQLGF